MWDLLHYLLSQDDVPVLIIIIVIFFRIFNLAWIMRHLNIMIFIISYLKCFHIDFSSRVEEKFI